jgi:hypothetical protein
MPRFIALFTLCCYVPLGMGADPTPVEKQLAIQRAMATARQYLQSSMPAEAVTSLEAEISNADGNKAFLALLKEAYLSEMASLMKDPTLNANRLSQVRRNIDILIGGKSATPTPDPSPASPTPAPTLPNPALSASGLSASPPPFTENSVADSNVTAATSAFKKGDYVQAERLFASIGAAKLNADQKAAWAYCRIRLAAEKVNAPQCDPATAAVAEKDALEAIKLVPQHLELQKIGQQVAASANLKASSREGTTQQTGPALDMTTKPSGMNGGEALETASFRVGHTGNRELADKVAKAAENLRKEIFERWSGPPSGEWEPKCEIVIHPTAEAYKQATNRPVSSTGNAIVRLSNGRATERRIDLRFDDNSIISNTLPRELTHIVLADLFPNSPPPKWAEEGMAILAETADEAGRYSRTLRRCAREGEWFGLDHLMELKDFPTDKITGFYCESVSLTEYLIHIRGERNFTIFLRDCHRYGTANSLKRQYGIDGPQALEAAWKRSVLDISRGQAP